MNDNDRPDLDDLEERAADRRVSHEFLGSLALRDQPVLIAEVRRLRAELDLTNDTLRARTDALHRVTTELDTHRAALNRVKALIDKAGDGYKTFGGGMSGGLVSAAELQAAVEVRPDE